MPTISNRSSGLLLHPTSLPSPYGIGDLGPAAYSWIDALAQARQRWWQVLPLSPTGYADSPYQALSAFAGNPNLISPDELVKSGLVHRTELNSHHFPDGTVDFDSGEVVRFKADLLRRAYNRFQSGADPVLNREFDHFQQAENAWLDDFALFMALKAAHAGRSWMEWEPDLRTRQPAALAAARASLEEPIRLHKFGQFVFTRQWNGLKAYAASQNVQLIGDVPIFVATDSADVWANPQFFLLDADRRPKAVAGVPPDYFSATGQLWGNPLYDWDALRQDGYAWWIARLRSVLRQVDVVRIDHFRGFEAYWQVPAGDPTAENGRWVKGPGADFFHALLKALGQAPIIAEDLGLITPEVDQLRQEFAFPGMRILQFAFAGAIEERFLPHHYEPNTIVYTGTHDNDTTVGWYASATESEKAGLERYLGCPVESISWDLIRLAWASVAVLAIAPLQDVLELGSEARMNLPGRAAGYWRWRFKPGQLTDEHLDRLADLTRLYGRG